MHVRQIILGDGLLGTELNQQTNWPVISRLRHDFDITNSNTWDQIKNTNTIINCICCPKTNQDKQKQWDVNYKGVADLVDFCSKKAIKLVQISTDFVYYNSILNATEEDAPSNSPDWYSYTKLLADGYVQLRSTNYLLIRCSHKPDPFPFEDAYINYVGNFDYVKNISYLIIQLITRKASGIYNVGTELKTMHQLAIKTKPNVNLAQGDYVNASMNINKMNTFLEI